MFSEFGFAKKTFLSLPVYFSKVKNIFKTSKWFLNIWICIYFRLLHMLCMLYVCIYVHTCILIYVYFLTWSYWAISTVRFWEKSGTAAFRLGTCPAYVITLYPLRSWPSTAFLLWGIHFAMPKKYSSKKKKEEILSYICGSVNIYQCPTESWCELLSFELCFRIGWSLGESSHLFPRHFSLFLLENEQRKGEGNCLC